MFTIRVTTCFSSAHSLREYKGKCEALHGHNWKVELAVKSGKLDRTGMVADFSDVKRTLEEVVGVLDHRHLNEIEYFKDVNPTSENIARFIFEEFRKKRPGLDVEKATVWETESSVASYSI